MRFEKVSFKQFYKDYMKCFHGIDNAEYNSNDSEPSSQVQYVMDIYNNIRLPQRATRGSAGYDFFSPYYCLTITNTPVTFPTGIRWIADEGQVLLLLPRSGQGFKYGLRLENTCGVIDADYFESDNEGHMMAKISASSIFPLRAGEAFMQGIATTYIVADDDECHERRNGGFGSTDKHIEKSEDSEFVTV